MDKTSLNMVFFKNDIFNVVLRFKQIQIDIINISLQLIVHNNCMYVEIILNIQKDKTFLSYSGRFSFTKIAIGKML